MAETAREGGELGRELQSILLKKRSDRQVQKYEHPPPGRGEDDPVGAADQIVDGHEADAADRPAHSAYRSELSRLSPMKKYSPSGTV